MSTKVAVQTSAAEAEFLYFTHFRLVHCGSFLIFNYIISFIFSTANCQVIPKKVNIERSLRNCFSVFY